MIFEKKRRIKSVTVIGHTQTEHFKIEETWFFFGLPFYRVEHYIGQAAA